MPLPEQERTVNSVGRDGISRRECPTRKYRANNLERMRDPIDTLDQLFVVHGCAGGACEVEHNFGLDAWLGKQAKRERKGAKLSAAEVRYLLLDPWFEEIANAN